MSEPENAIEDPIELGQDKPTSAARTAPRLLKPLVGIFLFLGSFSVVAGIWSAMKGAFYVDSSILLGVIGVGLCRRSRPWRPIAVAISCMYSLAVVVAGIYLLAYWSRLEPALSQLVKLTVGEQWAQVVLIGAAILAILLLVFFVSCVVVLTRPPVRQIFLTSQTRGLNIFGAICVLAVISIAVRETGGGLNLNLASTSFSQRHSSYGSNTSLADLGVTAPLLVDIHGMDKEEVFIITDIQVRRSNTSFGGTNTNTSWSYETFTGSPVAKAREKYSDAGRIEIEISRFDVDGPYWLPLFKTGTVKFKVVARGVGPLSDFHATTAGELKFRKTGISSVRSTMQRLRTKVSKYGIKSVTKSIAAEPKEPRVNIRTPEID